VRFPQIPIEPANLIVLAVSIVIASLCAAHLITISHIGVHTASMFRVMKFLIWRARSVSISRIDHLSRLAALNDVLSHFRR
jgi:hypothetical protein